MKTYTYKVVLLGNYEVGKTTLFRKLRGEADTRSEDLSDSLDLDPITLEYQLTDSLKVIVSYM